MSSAPSTPLVFYHAGLGKVASTYLQKRVFPALDGICYLPRNRFRGHRALIARGEHPRYLLSRECGKYLDRRLDEIAGAYPDARVLLFFRRHDQWIASHYRRYVKNGGGRDLAGYLDLAGDNGIWKRSQLHYMDMIERVRARFGHPPLVLTYDRLRNQPEDFYQRLCDFLGARLDRNRLGTRPVHRSYGEERLVRLRALNRRLRLAEPEGDQPPAVAHRLERRLKLYRSYLLLLAAGIGRANPGRLTPQPVLEEIRDHYADDWAALCAFEAAQFQDPAGR